MHRWTIVFWSLLLASTLYAFVRGGRLERAAASALLCAAAATTVVRSPASVRYSQVDSGVVVVDLVLLVVLSALGARSGRTWLFALATLQSITLVGHLGRWLEPDLWRLGYAVMITAPAWPGPVLVAVATWRRGSSTVRRS